MEKHELDLKIAEASKSILSYCMARTNSHFEAEDLSQDILAEIIKSAQNIRDPKAFYGFMWSVAGNVYKQWCKKKHRRKECKLSEDIRDESDIACDTEAKISKDTDILLLRRELALLNEKYRKALILYYLENKSCSEISQLLAVSESMVKYLLFKSRKILKEGMNMERKLGELSYNPKKLFPSYNGMGTNYFYSFMNNLIRQNIVAACYNDSLTPEEISLETGLALPYIDEDIRELTEKKILIKEGNRYKANVVIITRECIEEIRSKISGLQKDIANKICDFVSSYLPEFRKIGFYGSDFSENTLKWQLSVHMWRKCFVPITAEKGIDSLPVTAWGEHADIWLTEVTEDALGAMFNYCDFKEGGTIYFFDYLPKMKGDHHDFYGSEKHRKVLLDIAKQVEKDFSETELEILAELVSKGYVINENGKYRVTMPVFTKEQFEKINREVEDYFNKNIASQVQEIDKTSIKVVTERTPVYLREEAQRISSYMKYYFAIGEPIKIMVESKFLCCDYHPNEMPTMHIVLNDN